MVNASALVSKPSACSSGGNIAGASTSTAIRSRTEFAYSARLSRCNPADRPGLTCAAAARSSSDSSHPATASYVALSGRRMPGGGIERLRSFTTTFSQVSAELYTCSASALSSVRLAVFSFWLWHETQYLVTSSRAGVAAGAWAEASKHIVPIHTLRTDVINRHVVGIIVSLAVSPALTHDRCSGLGMGLLTSG